MTTRPPAEIGMSLDEVDTPALVVDLDDPWGKSESCTSCGKCVQVCPTGALFLKGKTVGEMRKDRSFINFIVTAREKHIWIR